MKRAVPVLLTLFLAFLLASGCAKRRIANQDAMSDQAQQPVMEQNLPQSQQPSAAQSSSVTSQSLSEQRAREQQLKTEMDRFQAEVIYFDFDSSLLRPDAQALLRSKADWLTKHPEAKSVTIEGHCDDRGTDAYNMALGERRAEEVKAFLVDLGLPASRLRTISYGEERPAVAGTGEAVWAKNRRAVFRLSN